jgi:hypothetical protein
MRKFPPKLNFSIGDPPVMQAQAQNNVPLFLMMVAYLLITSLLLSRYIDGFSRKLYIAFVAVDLGIAVGYMLPKGGSTLWSWYFHPNSEFAAGATNSTIQLWLIAFLAILSCVFIAKKWWLRIYWIFVEVMFFFIGMDEFFSFHETILYWRIYYLAAGAILVATSLLLYVILGWQAAWPSKGSLGQRILDHLRDNIAWRNNRGMILMALGFCVMGFGGVFMNAFSSHSIISFGKYSLDWWRCDRTFLGIDCNLYGFIQDFMEMAGETLVLTGVAAFVVANLDGVSVNRAKRAMLVGGVAFAVILFGNVWVLPAIQSALATPAQAQYLGGDLNMVSYSLNKTVVAPGDTLKVGVFFRTEMFLNDDYSVSVHLLTHPDITSVAQDDMLLGGWRHPSRGWIPGITGGEGLTIQLPAVLPTPRSYWLTSNVYPGFDWHKALPARRVDRARLDAGTLILQHIVVLSNDPVPQLATAASDEFGLGFSLSSYTLPDSAQVGQPLQMQFRWQTRQQGSKDFTQFVHLTQMDGSGFFTFDQQPFGGSFPTSDWPANIAMIDTLNMTLPADLPAGQYRVETGMYDTATQARADVTDSSGQPVKDNSIVLGTVTVGGA